MNKRTCTMPECDKPHRARDLCSTHYNQQQPNRHKPRTVACAFCGEPTETTGGGGRRYGATCSPLCKHRLTHGWSEPLPADHWALWYGKTSTWKPPAVQPARFITGWCRECGGPFTGSNNGDPHIYCSKKCRCRVGRRIRRAREHEAGGNYTWPEVIRLWISIDRCCAYCAQPTTVLEPDHVIPLSKGGSNSITNVVPSCGPCNRDKRDLLLSEWSSDRARRGLEPRTLDPRLQHLTHALLAA